MRCFGFGDRWYAIGTLSASAGIAAIVHLGPRSEQCSHWVCGGEVAVAADNPTLMRQFEAEQDELVTLCEGLTQEQWAV